MVVHCEGPRMQLLGPAVPVSTRVFPFVHRATGSHLTVLWGLQVTTSNAQGMLLQGSNLGWVHVLQPLYYLSDPSFFSLLCGAWGGGGMVWHTWQCSGVIPCSARRDHSWLTLCCMGTEPESAVCKARSLILVQSLQPQFSILMLQS